METPFFIPCFFPTEQPLSSSLLLLQEEQDMGLLLGSQSGVEILRSSPITAFYSCLILRLNAKQKDICQ